MKRSRVQTGKRSAVVLSERWYSSDCCTKYRFYDANCIADQSRTYTNYGITIKNQVHTRCLRDRQTQRKMRTQSRKSLRRRTPQWQPVVSISEDAVNLFCALLGRRRCTPWKRIWQADSRCNTLLAEQVKLCPFVLFPKDIKTLSSHE